MGGRAEAAGRRRTADKLSPQNRINFAVYRAQVENLAADVRLRSYEMPFNSDSSFWSNLGFMTRRPLRTAQDYRAYIDRLADVPRYFDQQIVNMRAGLARGFSVPHAVLDGRDVSIASVADLKDPLQSNFYEPFKRMPASIPADEQARLRADGVAAIRDRMVPAYAKLLKFFREEYVPQARTTLGASQMPDGEAYYRQQIREYTTLDLDPEQIHQIGLEEVARIQAEMEAIIKQVGFKAQPGQDTFAAVPALPAHRQAVLRDHAAGAARSRRLDLQARRRRDRQVHRHAAARSLHDRAGSGRHRPVLDQRPRRRRHLLAQHLRPALAPALQPAGADPARIGPGPRPAGVAGQGTGRAAGVPPRDLHLRLRRGLGPVQREAGQGDGHLRDARTRTSVA